MNISMSSEETESLWFGESLRTSRRRWDFTMCQGEIRQDLGRRKRGAKVKKGGADMGKPAGTSWAKGQKSGLSGSLGRLHSPTCMVRFHIFTG